MSEQTIANKLGPAFKEFAQRIKHYTQLFVLTGAGISAESGIPVYRDRSGKWQRSDPIQHQEFLSQPEKRKRYWARSMVGWRHVSQAKPTAGHLTLANLETTGRLSQLVTQNVDGLHQKAGSTKVIDLHGRLSEVICLDCAQTTSRAALQTRLESLNPDLTNYVAALLPDGDVDIDDYDLNKVIVPKCDSCGGILKPEVVFFGDNVPRARVEKATNALDRSDAMLVVGSSLQVFSGYRFCKQAAKSNTPIFCINLGHTRADDLFSAKLDMDAQQALIQLFEQQP